MASRIGRLPLTTTFLDLAIAFDDLADFVEVRSPRVVIGLAQEVIELLADLVERCASPLDRPIGSGRLDRFAHCGASVANRGRAVPTLALVLCETCAPLVDVVLVFDD